MSVCTPKLAACVNPITHALACKGRRAFFCSNPQRSRVSSAMRHARPHCADMSPSSCIASRGHHVVHQWAKAQPTQSPAGLAKRSRSLSAASLLQTWPNGTARTLPKAGNPIQGSSSPSAPIHPRDLPALHVPTRPGPSSLAGRTGLGLDALKRAVAPGEQLTQLVVVDPMASWATVTVLARRDGVVEGEGAPETLGQLLHPWIRGERLLHQHSAHPAPDTAVPQASQRTHGPFKRPLDHRDCVM